MIYGYIFGVLYALICLAMAFVAYKLGMPKKYSRKLVHILVGAEWIILSHYMGSTYHFLIVCVFFLIVLAVAHFANLMPMISSDSDNSPGTVYYALAMSVMSVIAIFDPDMMLPFGIGVFCTSLGDGMAGVIGQLIKKHNPKIYGNKSLFGAAANFVFSFGTALVFKYVFEMDIAVWQCAMIGLLSVGLELITVFGLDNVTITIGTAFLAYAFMYAPAVNSYIVPIVVTPFIIALVLEKKVLTANGLILALILDAVVSLLLENFGLVLLITFLAGSVLVDKIKGIKKIEDSITKKCGPRDGIQVIANGLIPMFMTLLFAGTSQPAFLFGYIASLSESLADTAASGMGVFSNRVVDIFRMRQTKKGLSGGMSVIGTVSALVASFIIPMIAFAFGVINWFLVIIIALSAFVGTVFDSLLGSLLQVKYKCKVCGEITEREQHCRKSTERLSGFVFWDNDVVNLFSSLFAALLTVVFVLVI